MKSSQNETSKIAGKKTASSELINSSSDKEGSGIKYIHNDIKNNYNLELSIFSFLFIIILWIVEEHLIEICGILKDLDFWMIEILIISYITSKMFKQEIYAHQKIVIIYNLLPIFLKIGTIKLSFDDKCNSIGNDYSYNYNSNSNNCDGKDKNRLQIIYVKNW